MFENITPEIIKQKMLSRLTFGLQTREGSFTNDLLSAAAAEIAEAYHSMDTFIPALILDESSGEYIDAHASFFDIFRKEGTKATCAITFTGTDGSTVPAGTTFSTAAGLTFSLDSDVTISGSTATGSLTAVDVGDKYNIGAGDIIYIMKNYSGIDSFSNDTASGGSDKESDAAFLSRFKSRFATSTQPSSGNTAHYMFWATSVDGVAFARVVGLWNGPGTVKVIIAGPDANVVDNLIVERCYDYIEENRPIGAGVTVVSAGAKEISIEAELTVDSSTTMEAVLAEINTSIKTYLKGLVETAFSDHFFADKETMEENAYSVIYNRIYFIVFSTPGVVDCTSLTINGSVSNVSIPADCVPVFTGVTVI